MRSCVDGKVLGTRCPANRQAMERFGEIDSSVDSPCINVCRLDESGVCTGCGRLLSEIADWSRMTNQKKRQVCEQAANRRKQKHRHPPIPEALAENTPRSSADPSGLARLSTAHDVHPLKPSRARGQFRPIVTSLGRSGT